MRIVRTFTLVEMSKRLPCPQRHELEPMVRLTLRPERDGSGQTLVFEVGEQDVADLDLGDKVTVTVAG